MTTNADLRRTALAAQTALAEWHTVPAPHPSTPVGEYILAADPATILELLDRVYSAEFKRHIVQTKEQLDALPDETVIRTSHGRTMEKVAGLWYWPTVSRPYKNTSRYIEFEWLPAMVIWTPESST